MKLKELLRKYLAAALLLAAAISLFAASILLLVSVYLLVMELLGPGGAHAFCTATNCPNRWWAPMVGSLVLMLISGVLWPIGVRKWRERLK
jgi:hypothetical protein